MTIVNNGADANLIYDDDSCHNPALRHTISFVRSYPELPKWVAYPDGDPAHELVVGQWRAHRSMQALRKSWKQEPELLDAALMFLAEEDERLQERWERVTSSPHWNLLPPSVRDHYTVLHALAAERGERGGRRVIMSHGWPWASCR